jgi:hypothetical protein
MQQVRSYVPLTNFSTRLRGCGAVAAAGPQAVQQNPNPLGLVPPGGLPPR